MSKVLLFERLSPLAEQYFLWLYTCFEIFSETEEYYLLIFHKTSRYLISTVVEARRALAEVAAQRWYTRLFSGARKLLLL